MERRARLSSESIDFLPTEHKAAANIFQYLEDEGIIGFGSEEQGTPKEVPLLDIDDEETIDQVGKLALFTFYLKKHERTEDRAVLNHLILADDSVASIWTDGDRYVSPGNVSPRVKRFPLQTVQHAHGKCSICPLHSLIRYNYGRSDFNNPIEDTPPLPDTAEFSEAETADECESCREYISDWVCTRINEDSRNLWLLGGSGIHYDIPLREDGYDVLDILIDEQPPTETEVADSELREIYGEANNGENYPGGETGEELLFNLVLGAKLYSEFSFDDLILNCKCRHPVETSNELDTVLIDYDRQKMVVLETTTAKSENNKLSQKQDAATQLKALSTYYEDLEVEYFYITTAEFPGDVYKTSGTWMLQQSLDRLGIPFQIISQPDAFDDAILNPAGIPTFSPEEVEEELSTLYNHIVDETTNSVREFLA